jgi:hypothetical protein
LLAAAAAAECGEEETPVTDDIVEPEEITGAENSAIEAGAGSAIEAGAGSAIEAATGGV